MKVSFFEVRERQPQLIAGTMDVRLHGSQRQIQNLRNLLIRPALHMAEENAGAVLRPE
jgi:phage pi2 protein 07